MRARRSVASMNTSDVEHAVAEIAEAWRGQRAERQARRHLERADFDRLQAAGFLEMAVPESMGGSWRDVATSTRPVCNARCDTGRTAGRHLSRHRRQALR